MVYRFGSYELDDERSELRRGGEPLAIQPKPLGLLLLLVRDRDRVVGQDELLDALWPGTAVTPGSLTRAVSTARRAIGDTRQGVLIRSYARRGYRFCGDVVELGGQPKPLAADTPPAEAPERRAGTRSEPFVGRDDALAALRRAWTQAESGRGAVVVVSGPPGVGKTRLVEVFGDELRGRGERVWVGRCRDSEGVPAYWLWVQVLRALLEDSDPQRVIEQMGPGAHEVADLVPELAAARADTAARGEPSPEQSRFLFFDALTRTLAAAGRARPVTLVLEDLQWAGRGSLRLFEHLASELRNARLLVLATVRDEARERHHPLNRALSILAQQDHASRLALEGFAADEVARLLEAAHGAPPPARLAEQVLARTEGIPLFVREVVHRLADAGHLEQASLPQDLEIELPPRARDLLLRTVESLSDACVTLLGSAAVLGREFALPLLAAVGGTGRADALDQLDEAARAGVVVPTEGSAGTYRFAHALFQELMLEGLPVGRRARLHHAAAQRLESQHATDPELVISELAHHYHQGLAVADAGRALYAAERAAARAEQLRAWEEAALHYRQALDAIEHLEPFDPERRLATLLRLGEACRFAGDRTQRLEVLTEALRAARSLSRPDEFARAAIAYSDLTEWGPRDPRAVPILDEALERVGPEPSVARARLTTRRAFLRPEAREDAAVFAREAVALAAEVGDGETLQEALYLLLVILGGPHHMTEREQITREMGRVTSGLAYRDLAMIAHLDVASDRLALGDGDGARGWRRTATHVAGDLPHPGLVWHLLVFDAGLAHLEGRFDDAEQLAREAWLLGERIGHPYARANHLGVLGLVLRDRGEPAALVELFAETSRRRTPGNQWSRALYASALAAVGERTTARALLDEIFEDGLDGIRTIRKTNSLVAIGELCADLEDGDRAQEVCRRLEPLADQHGVFPIPVAYTGPVAHTHGRLLELLGRADEAAELYVVALASAESLGARPAAARAAVAWGTVATRRPRLRARSRERLERGAALAAQLGMRALGERARQQLAALPD